MFVIELSYKAALTEIDKHMNAHFAFLNNHYAAGRFVVSGRKIPREGGIIVASAIMEDTIGWIMIAMAVLLTIIFVSIAMLAAVLTRDKAKGIGVSILLWLYFSLLFDGLALFILFQFQDYPMEKAMVVMSGLNPIDLGRILILLKMDISALMGYSGAIFRDSFGSGTGFIIALLVMIAWILIPTWFSLRKFSRKDL